MSAQKAADELHLDGWVIDALEADDYERIGPSVYAKGHLKRYAALLGLPAAEIMAGYESRVAGAENRRRRSRANVRLRTDTPAVSNLAMAADRGFGARPCCWCWACCGGSPGISAGRRPAAAAPSPRRVGTTPPPATRAASALPARGRTPRSRGQRRHRGARVRCSRLGSGRGVHVPRRRCGGRDAGRRVRAARACA